MKVRYHSRRFAERKCPWRLKIDKWWGGAIYRVWFLPHIWPILSQNQHILMIVKKWVRKQKPIGSEIRNKIQVAIKAHVDLLQRVNYTKTLEISSILHFPSVLLFAKPPDVSNVPMPHAKNHAQLLLILSVSYHFPISNLNQGSTDRPCPVRSEIWMWSRSWSSPNQPVLVLESMISISYSDFSLYFGHFKQEFLWSCSNDSFW